ncbi:MAG: N-acetylneuraminate synthase family protein [Smithella sp.]
MFEKMKRPLFILEMANNHMGDVDHGIKIIRAFKDVAKKYKNFDFAFKLQLRNKSIIHPDYQERMDIKHIKRFTETRLTPEHFKSLLSEIKECGFISMCTPFDEESVDEMGILGFDVYKAGSCSFADWPLMEKFGTVDKPMIISTGGVNISDMDNVVVFLKHRKRDFSLMHCVTAYPTQNDELQLNQIDFLKNRYDGVEVGFSTHEVPGALDPVKLAIAKGAMIFEKHVGVKTDKYSLNDYSATPEQADMWLKAASEAFDMCGTKDERMSFTEAAQAGVRPYIRGAFAKRNISKGEKIKVSDMFFAMPNFDNQVLAKNASKYTELTAKEDIAQNAPVMLDKVAVRELRGDVFSIVKAAVKMLKDANVAVPNGVDCSISVHYGIEKFHENGLVMIDVLNREYCKKLLVMLPGQNHPTHAHKVKEETFHILNGDITVDLDGKVMELQKGDLLTIKRGQKHSFKTKNGVIIEEISTTHIKEDSYYDDPAIVNNKHRKIEFSLWLDIFGE